MEPYNFNHLPTVKDIVLFINNSPVQGFERNNPEFLAASYAVTAQKESGFPICSTSAFAHFDILLKNGAKFDTSIAEKIALFDFSDYIDVLL